MSTHETQARLYDSEATLRLVDGVLEELQLDDQLILHDIPTSGTPRLQVVQVASLSPAVDSQRAFEEVQGALEVLRRCQGALAPLSRPDGRLPEAELEFLDRALDFMDQLASAEDLPASTRSDLEDQLRGELLALACQLQTRESVSSHLRHTANLLQDLEEQLIRLSRRTGTRSTRDEE